MVKGSYRERTERGKVKESRALVNMGCWASTAEQTGQQQRMLTSSPATQGCLFAGPRRPLAPGVRASPWLEPLNITSLNHPQHLSSLCTKPGPCNNHITSIKHWIAGESVQLQHGMSDVRSPVKQERLCSSYVNSLCSALRRYDMNYAFTWIFLSSF